jgi:hypothetical protein
MKSLPLLGYFGHHKGATVWIRSIIIQVCKALDLNHAAVSNVRAFNKDLTAFVSEKNIDFISYTNASFKYVQPLKHLRGFHVVRDPRDIVVSAYFSHLNTHVTEGWSELVEFRERLKSVSKDEGLILEMDFRKGSFKNMYDWDYSCHHIKELKMEDLIQHPQEKFVEVFRHLGLIKHPSALAAIAQRVREAVSGFEKRLLKPVPKEPPPNTVSEEELAKIIQANAFSAKAGGRKPGEEDLSSHYRKGIAGDWKNHFTQQHIDYFKANYGDLLLKLGYEKSQNW